MIFKKKNIILKNGKAATLATPNEKDAKKMLDYIKVACGETDFLLRYPEEFDIDVVQEEKWINRLRLAPNTLMIACYVDGEIAGNCEINFESGIKTSHRASIHIALLKAYWNLGIGSTMFDELIAAAQKRNIEMIEIEFLEGNERARHLYEKFGFCVVCEKPNIFKLKNGTYLKEIYMQKYLKKM